MVQKLVINRVHNIKNNPILYHIILCPSNINLPIREILFILATQFHIPSLISVVLCQVYYPIEITAKILE